MKKQKHSNLKFLAGSKTELFFSYLIQFFCPERSWKLEFTSPSFQGFINTLDFAVLKSWGKIYWLALVEEFHPCIRLLQWNTWTAPLPPKKNFKEVVYFGLQFEHTFSHESQVDRRNKSANHSAAAVRKPKKQAVWSNKIVMVCL